MYSNIRWSMLYIAELYSWQLAQPLREMDRRLRANFSSVGVVDVDVRLRSSTPDAELCIGFASMTNLRRVNPDWQFSAHLFTGWLSPKFNYNLLHLKVDTCCSSIHENFQTCILHYFSYPDLQKQFQVSMPRTVSGQDWRCIKSAPRF